MLDVDFQLLTPGVHRVGGWCMERCLRSRWIPEFYFQSSLSIGFVTTQKELLWHKKTNVIQLRTEESKI